MNAVLIAVYYTTWFMCVPVTQLWWGVPVLGNQQDPCRRQTGPGVWGSGEAESSTPAQSQWSPVHCGRDTLISGGLYLRDQGMWIYRLFTQVNPKSLEYIALKIIVWHRINMCLCSFALSPPHFGSSPVRALANSSRCCCRKRAVRPQACRDSLAKTGQQDRRQDRDSDTLSPRGFKLTSSSSRHYQRGKGNKISSSEMCVLPRCDGKENHLRWVCGFNRSYRVPP